MKSFLVEIEDSELNTYRVTATDVEQAKKYAVENYEAMRPIEQHSQVKVTICVEEVK